MSKLAQRIPLEGVEGRIEHLGLDSTRHRLFVAAIENNTLEVIDLAAGKRIKSISGLKGPAGVRVAPASGRIVVASGDDGCVRVFDADLQLVGKIDGLDDADNVRIDSDGKVAYVGYGNGALAAIDVQQAKKIGEVKLDAHPEAFQLEEHGPRIFINIPHAKQVAVVDREQMKVLTTWRVTEAEANFPMALDEANHRILLGCRKPARLLVLDMSSVKNVASVNCCGDTDDLFYDAASKQIVLTGGEGCISVIAQRDADHYELAGKIVTASGARTSMYDPATARLYVAVPHRADQPAEIRCYESAHP